MAQEKHQKSNDSEMSKIEEADRKGKVNIVKSIMDDPEVQGIIKQSLLRETIKNAIVMSCLLVGLLKIYDVAKTLINFNWVGDLIIATILLAVGLIYLFQTMFSLKKNGNSKADRSNSDVG